MLSHIFLFVYIFITIIFDVGIALGLMIDVIFFEFFNWLSAKFVEWENCEKKTEYETRVREVLLYLLKILLFQC
jgi:hypothetical protein